MIRNVLGILLLFLLPTLAYLGYALLMRPAKPARVIDEAPLVWLAVSGLLLVFGTLIYYGSTSGKGGLGETHAPAGSTDGQIEPGHAR